MAIHHLTSSQAILLPSGPGRVRAHAVAGASLAGLRIEVEGCPVHRIDDAHVAVLGADGEADVRAVPIAGTTFAPNTRVQVVLSLGEGTPDAAEVWCAEVDLSGSGPVTLLNLAGAGGNLSVRLPAAAPTTGAGGLALSGRSREASYAWREAVAADRAKPATIAIQVVLDHSASMLPHVRSGLVQELCEVLVGVGHELTGGPDLPTWVLSDRCVPVPALGAGTVAGWTERNLAQLPYGHGWDFTMLTEVAAAQRATVTYVLTDEAPASTWPAAADHHWHLLALARSATGSATGEPVEEWADELGDLREAAQTGGLSISTVPGGDPAEMLRGDRLTRLVSSLVPAPARGPQWRPI